MKVIFNKDFENIILEFDEIKENISFKSNLIDSSPIVQVELIAHKYDLPVEKSMYDYCIDLFNCNIQTIHCYDIDEELKMIYDKYNTISTCMTYFGATQTENSIQQIEDSYNISQNKIGTIIFIQ